MNPLSPRPAHAKKLNKVLKLVLTLHLSAALALPSGSFVQAAPRAPREKESTTFKGGFNPLFARTHLLPSPFTLPAGRLVFGSAIAYGLTDFFQVGTDLLRDIYGFYNANAKLSVVQMQGFAAALTAGYESYNLREISSLNPDMRISSWQPGMVTAFALLPQVAIFVGTSLNYTKYDLLADAGSASGFQRGARSEVDLSWGYNPSNAAIALATGVSYDWTYHLVGYGVSHHWPGFHIGVHYYPNAGINRVQPILAGGGSVDF